jgi:hypothetical protein
MVARAGLPSGRELHQPLALLEGDPKGGAEMKLKFIEFFGDEQPKGTEVEVDKIRFDLRFRSGVGVRVVNLWKRPVWMCLGWFIKKKGGGGDV